MHPLPTIFRETIKMTSLLPNMTAPRKPPVERNVVQCETETDAYMKLALKSFSDINELEVFKSVRKLLGMPKISQGILCFIKCK